MTADLLCRATAIACEAHRDQRDKQGEPYIFHVMRVALAVEGYEAKAVAMLHDVLEDCAGWHLLRLKEAGISQDVRMAVYELTRDESETYAEYIERVALNPLARAVKLADLADNLRPERISTLPPEQAASLAKRYHAAYARLSRETTRPNQENG